MNSAARASHRLYKEVAGRLMSEIESGKYAVGARLPAERDLATMYEVSRPVIREAIISLEVQGLVDVRVGSGVYVQSNSGQKQVPAGDVSAIELTEARLLIESEVAALAAAQISDDELAELEDLVRQIEEENKSPDGREEADAAFHTAIARASRNNALIETVERLWDLRRTSREAALLHEKARHANIKPVVDEHSAILRALQARDPKAARAAMRGHLLQVLESLLFATEQRAVDEARRSMQAKRDRYSRLTA
ncbi:FadR/GntR family transcriptional regulator [Croceicoccus marinus]|jgi:GntR family transcriptional repressor for pyruvate dehydrogenase complex|uniref:FadR family transcriptional regulator n=1 Tax=Croceicoccus marinus TaxID=450378 RepID=A0A1Z1FGH6_9SPHN|nr:FadR/GntR family transcriptional regulator [Croceicoccus marinus]ARU17830.1 GntR family transcriptional regulator [Croceicoccus marinus]QNE07328.1 FadR family transcriptional regulator [Croceicoccus marinus]